MIGYERCDDRMISFDMLTLLLAILITVAESICSSNRLWEGHTTAWLQPNFCSQVIAGGGEPVVSQLHEPRGLHIDKDTDEILLVERAHPNGARVIRLDNPLTDTKIVSVAERYGLNHGLELSNGYLYASTPGKVYRWAYTAGQMDAGNSSTAELVIENIDAVANSTDLGAKGGHTTRTLAFDPDGKYLYVSTGSKGNVALNSYRARIRRFDLTTWDGVPFDFAKGEVFADGLRNEVGLAFDSHAVLWGVENGADNLYREDLGGDIHNENPGEELNRFRIDQVGQHWGYPYCFTEYCLSTDVGGTGLKGGNNTIWAWPSFTEDGYTDEWCKENTIPSIISMPSHSAPLGITFYDWKNMTQYEYESQECNGGFPKGMDKFAFIAFHGSWNREPPTGYKIVFVPFDEAGEALYQPIDLFRHGKRSASWSKADIRPVDVQFDKCGRLFVTEDGTGSIILITYEGNYFEEKIQLYDTDVADGVECQAMNFPANLTILSPAMLTVNFMPVLTAVSSISLALYLSAM